jgi:hypothetical protein
VRPEAGIACHGHDQEFRIWALKVKVSDGLGSVLHHGIRTIVVSTNVGFVCGALVLVDVKAQVEEAQGPKMQISVVVMRRLIVSKAAGGVTD